MFYAQGDGSLHSAQTSNQTHRRPGRAQVNLDEFQRLALDFNIIPQLMQRKQLGDVFDDVASMLHHRAPTGGGAAEVGQAKTNQADGDGGVDGAIQMVPKHPPGWLTRWRKVDDENLPPKPPPDLYESWRGEGEDPIGWVRSALHLAANPRELIDSAAFTAAGLTLTNIRHLESPPSESARR